MSYMSWSDWTALRTVRALPKEHLRKPGPEQSWSVDAMTVPKACRIHGAFPINGSCTVAAGGHGIQRLESTLWAEDSMLALNSILHSFIGMPWPSWIRSGCRQFHCDTVVGNALGLSWRLKWSKHAEKHWEFKVASICGWFYPVAAEGVRFRRFAETCPNGKHPQAASLLVKRDYNDHICLDFDGLGIQLSNPLHLQVTFKACRIRQPRAAFQPLGRCLFQSSCRLDGHGRKWLNMACSRLLARRRHASSELVSWWLAF